MKTLRVSLATTLLLLAASSCAPANNAPPPAMEPPPASAVTTPQTSTPSSAPTDAPASVDKPPPIDEVAVLDFKRAVEAPVHHVGFGKKGRVAAIGEDVWLDEGKGFKKLPAPGMATSDVRIYFGRDNKPRLMGYAGSGETATGVYRRWRGGRWQRGLDEIGRLGGGKTPFFGVLGYADPEVVCRIGQICLIKRLTGWKTVQPPAGLPQVVLAHGKAWALSEKELWRLEGDAKWQAYGGTLPFSKASAVWATSATDVWVAEVSGALHRFDGTTWTTTKAVVDAPLGLWAADPNGVWLVGRTGAAHFDGKAWRRVKGPKGPLQYVEGLSAKEVWLAGPSGLWRGTATSQ